MPQTPLSRSKDQRSTCC